MNVVGRAFLSQRSAERTARLTYIGADAALIDWLPTVPAFSRFEIFAARAAAEGCDHHRTRPQDVVVIEHRPPDLDGIDAARRLLAVSPYLPFVMLAPPGSEGAVGGALALGISAIVIRDADGRFRDLLPATVTNLLERGVRLQRIETAEAALRDSEQRYHDLVAAAPLCIHEIDLEGRLYSMNPAGLKMMGVTEEAAVAGLAYLDVPRESERPRIARLLEKAKQGERSSFEFTVDTEDGVRIFSSSFEPITDATGTVVRLMGVTEDITTRRQSERDRERLLSAIEKCDEGIILFDADDRLVYANTKYHELYPSEVPDLVPGNRFRDIIKRCAYEGIVPAAVGREEEWIEERVAAHQALATSGEQRISTGRWVRVSEFRTDDGGIFGLRTDITELKETQHQLNLAKERAEQANTSKSDFLAHMSHELRTPLNSIIGFAEVMAMEMLGPLGTPRYREYADDVMNSGTHLLHLVNDILDLSKIETSEVELLESEVDLAETVSSCLNMIKGRAAAQGIAIVPSIAEDLPRLTADRRYIKQIVINLLSNAVKYTRDGGTVTLAADRAADRADDASLRVTIADTGIGIAAEDIPKVIEPFGQVVSNARMAHEGTGLGLSLSKKLTELHDGTLRIDSTLGVGTRVTVTFPAWRTLRDRAAPNDTGPTDIGPDAPAS